MGEKESKSPAETFSTSIRELQNLIQKKERDHGRTKG